MTKLEQIERLRERANVTYDEAKAALEAADGDLLEAIIYLERQGKVNPPQGGGFHSTAGTSSFEEQEGQDEQRRESGADTFMQTLDRIGKFCAKVIKRANNTTFEVLKDNESKVRFPVTVLALLVIFAPHITLPLILIGLFFGFHYRFVGVGFSDL
ncbi:MAG: hypothetical protein AA931_07935 [Peptococcaceae bacterium 1109]|nr:MAG: hypothetical protein AA931_07935 [Peptococcaceae bacterium 1109]